MPLIQAFGARLREEGVAADNWYLSIDEDQQALQAFLASHPELTGQGSLRALAPERVEEWMKTLGLEEGTSIPVSVLAAPDGKVRCVRTGSIHDGDYPVVRAIFDELARPPAP
ncbi:MAG TPA: hypothetical protein P5076_09985 [Myxococcota bacterium]|nr:hypothetical protein [Myxococcota bacterium]